VKKQVICSLLVFISVLIAFFPMNAGPSEPIFYGSRFASRVALTFDDVPCPGSIEKILSILRQENVKATFFVIGYMAERHPELLKMIYDEGHEIANHTFSHPWMTDISEKDQALEISSCQEVIRQIIGIEPKFFRPPFIDFDERTIEIVRSLGLIMVNVEVDSKDYSEIPVSEIIDMVTDQSRNGSIFLFHDGDHHDQPRIKAIEALPSIIRDLREEGYEFVMLSELLES